MFSYYFSFVVIVYVILFLSIETIEYDCKRTALFMYICEKKKKEKIRSPYKDGLFSLCRYTRENKIIIDTSERSVVNVRSNTYRMFIVRFFLFCFFVFLFRMISR